MIAYFTSLMRLASLFVRLLLVKGHVQQGLGFYQALTETQPARSTASRLEQIDCPQFTALSSLSALYMLFTQEPISHGLHDQDWELSRI